MEVLSKAKYYKVKCEQCASIIKFGYYDVCGDNSSYNHVVYCPVCNKKITVAKRDWNYQFSLTDNVEPIYEG